MASIKQQNHGEILLYKPKGGVTKLEVRVEGDTVWLSLNQMTDLFDRDKSVISRHLRNIFKTRELIRNRVVAKNATTATDGKVYQVEYYNLDAIISVGYRVNSKRGTQFRKWATNVLRAHLVQGYTLNEKRLKQEVGHYSELKNAIGLIGDVIQNKALDSDEAGGLLRVITDFAYALDVLDAYDYQRLDVTGVSRKKGKSISYEEARSIIVTLRQQYKAAELFGREKDDTLKSSLGNIFQTFNGKQLYPSMEEKAAHLLYFLVKNHHFTDGNKRIGAFLFLWFLDKNNALYHKDGSKRIADNALVAMTLMIAESNPKHKDIIVKVMVNLINNKN
ncbi:MAG: virulence protein RhuM/Fic/DOC family protein [Anaerohalosphaera sp.]|nr:virulence protein RhuM/Fic/DOC family protein [Anaerohalosphaera sp.]